METPIRSLESEAVDRIFAERKDFIIIGLTGRTGAGCTTIARFMCKEFSDLQPPADNSIDSIQSREDKIIYCYAKDAWKPFRLIEVKHIIFSFALEENYDRLIAFMKSEWPKEKEAFSKLDVLEKEFNELHEKRIFWKKEVAERTDIGEAVPNDEDLYEFYFKTIPAFFTKFKAAVDKKYYTLLLQKMGDNIRASGSAYSSEISPDKILYLPQRINMMIKILRRRNIKEKKRVLVVIDAFRNPYEATFFKDRYSAFYLFAVNTPDEERKRRLVEMNFENDAIIALDKKEYPSLNNTIQDYYTINLEKTIEIADVHINNPYSASGTCDETKRQLVRYVSLIMHPGLVPPTEVERCMQIAYDSKLNSGCLSRQVGAVITDGGFNVIANGWNCAPDKQVPCTLRSLFSLVRDDCEDLIGTSFFERSDKQYRAFLKENVKNINFDLLHGRNCSYCFKDAYNEFNGKSNQVHTRSIHAEEMAFLQSAKIGMPTVEGGFLFTTASPCELCSKKAYHTGIRKIIYIDQYPGISYKHVLSCGENPPEMILFHGAIGRAYTQLYTQILPYKDELYMLLGLAFKTKTDSKQATDKTTSSDLDRKEDKPNEQES